MKTLSGGGFQYPNAVAVASGTLQLALSIDATVIGTGQIAPQVVTIALDTNGDVSGTPQVYGNDELSPDGTVYTAQVVDSNGARVYGPQLWNLAGSSPINLDNLQALLAEDVVVNFPSAVLLNPSAAQTITNFGLTVPSLTATAGITGDALTAISSLTVGSGTAVTKVVVYSQTLTPASVAAATVAEQTFTVTGLTTADKVVVNPPAIANATGIAGARVSAANTLAIRYVNPTAGALTPTSGTYTVVAFRS